MEIKKSDRADLENKRWVGFLLGIIIALSVFFVAMEYNAAGTDDDAADSRALKNVTLHDLDMLPAIDQQDLAKKQDEKKPTIEDMLNLKRRDIPNKVTPRNAGSMNANDRKTGAPQVNDDPIIMPMVTTTPEPPKVKEEAKKEMEKMTDDPSEEEAERYDDKVSKRILSQTPTPPGGWVEFMKWLTKTLQYPADAKQKQVQGTVNITFIINVDGTVDDVRVKSGKIPVLNAEALRVLRTMGRWKPGIEKNRPCRSLVEIPIVFQLS
ncbi:energy transducer TonB [Prevotella multiformis]|uniref:energy transducer TonB n=1 Tax=Prevotella multiformis TaxID=282402 RepID=UPI003F9EC000